MQGGEIFIPKIPSMKIIDLAKAMCPKCEQEIIGIRPGEKMHEIMISKDDSHLTIEFNDYYTIIPTIRFKNQIDYTKSKLNENGKKVEYGFEYSSGTNDWWLSEEEFLKMAEEFL